MGNSKCVAHGHHHSSLGNPNKDCSKLPTILVKMILLKTRQNQGFDRVWMNMFLRTAFIENSTEFQNKNKEKENSTQAKDRTTIKFRNPATGYVLKGAKTIMLKDFFVLIMNTESFTLACVINL